MTILRKLDVRQLRANSRNARLGFQIQTVQLLERIIQHREFRIEQVDQRKILRQQLLEKEDRLIMNGRLELGVVVFRKQVRVRLDIAAELSSLEPLLDELLRHRFQLV